MLHRIIQRPLNTAFDKLYARRAAKFPINPDGVLRVRHPALILISVFISALVGTLLTALIVYMVLNPNTTQTPPTITLNPGVFYPVYCYLLWLSRLGVPQL